MRGIDIVNQIVNNGLLEKEVVVIGTLPEGGDTDTETQAQIVSIGTLPNDDDEDLHAIIISETISG